MMKQSLSLPSGKLDLEIERNGKGRPLLLLHGGAGPRSMGLLAAALDGFDRVIPTHPGFDGTHRPPSMSSVTDLAECYIALIRALGLRDVVAIGNSAGGWIAAEMAARSPVELAGIVLVDAVGIEPDETTGPIGDPRSMPMEDLVKLSFANPARAPRPTPEAAGRMQENQRALMAYAGAPFMHDPTLAGRLSRITISSLVLWGREDGIVTERYGRKYARCIPGARFETIEDAGHLPQIEQPEITAHAISGFCRSLE